MQFAKTSMIKPILLTLGISSLSASAAVSFNFDYSASAEFMGNATARASLEDAANTVGGFFAHTATIDIRVTSSNANTSTLASAGSAFSNSGSAGFGNRGIVGTKILGGVDANGAQADGTVDVNFFHNWNFGDTIGASELDFKSTIIHELIHAVGFSSSIFQNGSDPFGNAAGTPNGFWAPFDRFIGDATGAIIDPSTFTLDSARWNAASVGGTGASGLRFLGVNAVAANGGNPVFIYSPTTWSDGSSGSHLDDDFYMGTHITEAAAGSGPGIRTLSAIERGILQDIGFTLTPEPSSTALLGFGSLALILVRRRK